MEHRNPDLVSRRSELLATVALTRRLDIEVRQMDLDSGIDFVGIIRPEPDEELQGFLLFGVVVKGTARPLPSHLAAEKFFRAHRSKSGIIKGKYFFPVIVLLFSMNQDEGYFSWFVEPDVDTETLIQHTDLAFKPFDLRQLDQMISRIKKWYQRLSVAIAPQALLEK
jgi:hypothetical protein